MSRQNRWPSVFLRDPASHKAGALRMDVLPIVFVLLAIMTLVVMHLQHGSRVHLATGITPAQLRGWKLWVTCLLLSALLSLLANWLAGNPYGSSVTTARKVFSTSVGTDSWGPMAMASDWLGTNPGASVYEALFFDLGIKFQYPVTALLMLDLPKTALGWDTARTVAFWQATSRLSIFVLAATVMSLLTQRKPTDATPPRWLWPVFFTTALATTVLFYPVARSEMLGQVQTLLTVGIALALCAWRHGRIYLAGALIGLCCLVKPHWGLIVLWGLLRKQWHFAMAAMAVGIAGLLAAAALYGMGNLLGYIEVLTHMSQRGESFHANQSINGLVHRLLFNGPNLEWSANTFPPYHPWVHAATVASSAMLLAFGLWWQRRAQPTALHLSHFVLVLTMASPIAWEHHYAALLPVGALMVAHWASASPKHGNGITAVLALSLVLVAGAFGPLLNMLASTRWNFMQSYVLFSALALLGGLSFMLHQSSKHADDTP